MKKTTSVRIGSAIAGGAAIWCIVAGVTMVRYGTRVLLRSAAAAMDPEKVIAKW